ncbi:hypothetical protein I350_01906 [Cryptococcus amylolentus CBS 6273]|uniref:Uncharacterized protein n=1 Tax=Cryptococcus amylolentus CBS 6273 TaxID=1296118 RepID=A0A1E3KBQ6_9TREE|nr:hypothetical protein I350_01906 [Cryptococcus amylolentus CBS 6273]
MMCIKHMLLYVLVFPLASSPSLILALLALGSFLKIRPCGYCMTLATILFFSTSPSSPFLARPSPSLLTSPSSSPVYLTNTTLPLSLPLPSRSWLAPPTNVWDPLLIGYSALSAALAQERKYLAEHADDAFKTGREVRLGGMWEEGVESLKRWRNVEWAFRRGEGYEGLGEWRESASDWRAPFEWVDFRSKTVEKRKSLPSTPAAPLPKGYIDLRYKGLGWVVDMNWRRSEEGLKWEVEQVLGREWDREELEEMKLEEEGVEEVEVVEEREAKVEEVQEEKKGWRSIPFVGSW